jgi:erythrocyte band 7 integral membrane protein
VERVEVKDVRLPVQMQRAMATEAETTREARAKVIHFNIKILIAQRSNIIFFMFSIKVIAAEGEQKASVALKQAADVIDKSPVALQLRYLQTLTNIAAEKNSTIVFPVCLDLNVYYILDLLIYSLLLILRYRSK